MNTAERRQFLEIVQHFKLASEATREALASQYVALTSRQADEQEPVTPVLGFCMEHAGSPERAESIFDYVLHSRNLAYWPRPEVPAHLRGVPALKAACYHHAIVPIKAAAELVVLSGTNYYDGPAMEAVCRAIPELRNPYQVFVLSDPGRILRALEQFETSPVAL